MLEVPRPTNPGERVFVSCYRFDGFRSFLVNVLLPTLGLVALFSFPLLSFFLFRSFESQGISGELKNRLYLLTGVLAAVGPMTALGFFLLWFALKRKIYETVIFCSDEGLRLQSGSREIQCRWEDIQDLRTRDFGRYQTATVVVPGGKISIDATMVDGHGPRPAVRMTIKGEQMVFPNGDIQPLRIQENELYGIIRKRYESKKS